MLLLVLPSRRDEDGGYAAKFGLLRDLSKNRVRAIHTQRGEDRMRSRGLFLSLVLAGATLALEAPITAQEMQRLPVRLLAFLPRSPLRLDLKRMASDNDDAGCRGIPGTCHGRCENDEFCGTLVSSDGKRYCGCSAK